MGGARRRSAALLSLFPAARAASPCALHTRRHEQALLKWGWGRPDKSPPLAALQGQDRAFPGWGETTRRPLAMWSRKASIHGDFLVSI